MSENNLPWTTMSSIIFFLVLICNCKFEFGICQIIKCNSETSFWCVQVTMCSIHSRMAPVHMRCFIMPNTAQSTSICSEIGSKTARSFQASGENCHWLGRVSTFRFYQCSKSRGHTIQKILWKLFFNSNHADCMCYLPINVLLFITSFCNILLSISVTVLCSVQWL